MLLLAAEQRYSSLRMIAPAPCTAGIGDPTKPLLMLVLMLVLMLLALLLLLPHNALGRWCALKGHQWAGSIIVAAAGSSSIHVIRT